MNNLFNDNKQSPELEVLDLEMNTGVASIMMNLIFDNDLPLALRTDRPQSRDGTSMVKVSVFFEPNDHQIASDAINEAVNKYSTQFP